MKQSTAQLTGRKALLTSLILLPMGCLLWKWNTLPAQVPMHSSRNGADWYGDKHLLIGFVLVPLVLYAALPSLSAPTPTEAIQVTRRIGTGAVVFLSLVLCAWLLVGIAPT